MSTTITTDEVLAAIREELTAIKVDGAAEATADTTWADLDVDSLDLVELVKALEDRFDVSISDDSLKSIASVGDAIDVVTSLRGV